MNKDKRKNRARRHKKKGPTQPMLLTAYNYKLLIVGVICVLLGFGGMYLEGQQYGIYSLYIAPLLVIFGFIIVAFSVFRTDPALLSEEPEKESSTESPSTHTTS
jgi:hypothetical protein